MIEAIAPFFGIAVIGGFVALAMWVDRSAIARVFPGALVVLLGGALCANAWPASIDGAAAGFIVTVGLPVAIAILLVPVDFRRAISGAGALVKVFACAVCGTVFGVVVAALLLPAIMDKPALAGTVASTLIGGSMNYLAVSEITGFSRSPLNAPTLAVDVLLGVGYLALLFWASRRRWFARLVPAQQRSDPGGSPGNPDKAQPVTDNPAFATVFAIVVALVIAMIAQALANGLGIAPYALLILTALALFVGIPMPSLRPHFSAAQPFALIAMYAFFFVIGASLDAAALSGDALYPAAFYAIALTGHAAFLIAGARIFGFGPDEVLIASNASILGPPTAAGMAAANGWQALVTPGLLVGLLGYAIANFIGAAIAGILAAL